MQISSLKIEVKPWRFKNTPAIELRWKVMDGEGKITESCHIFNNKDDMKSLFDVIWDQAKQEVRKTLKI